ncbi:tetraacyldisaccharide 4'-kinase [Palleronia sediminis]|uniref:Tetraacyldisaccharide 4'-kinase n=1 Tax=Palleronia sediminis TaxID=2547833 RepID=A0A4R6A691_9RHOB|nr:tetraacyldisaccharide 4'-kinase [Palleronia sediminis]TDL78217.1 tetraacyldisaccharide 4'-kinase [Palleronia sediminis]
MKPPAFWSRPPEAPGWQARALAPLAALYRRQTARRVAAAGATVGRPVICVGNINAGGTGKTPTVVAVLDRLQRLGIAAHVVSRGYGGRAVGVVRVDPARHAAADVGDEPLMLAAFAPVWVGRDRAAAARAAVDAGAGAIVLDDGFQSPALRRDLSIVVVDAHVGFGNGRVIPAGPLREPVAAGLARADLLLSIGPSEAQERFTRDWPIASAITRLRGALEPLQTGMTWGGLRVLAFAGIGRPEKAFDTMRGLGMDVVRTVALADHQPLTTALMMRLEREAMQAGAQLVTTEKDAVRLPASFRHKVLFVPVRLQIDDPAPLDTALGRLFA